jgi:sporulation protein YlmC with PRC-barrel domain
MLRFWTRFAAAALLVAAVAPVWAEDVPVRKAGHYRAKMLMGAKVYISGGTAVGTVQDIILTDEGVVDYLIVSEDGKLVTVPWEAARFDTAKRTATIEITRERFRKIPTYTVERYPDYYAPAYRTEVYGYYGLKPGPIRRLERRIERRP